jgi:two-component system sensor histidine kinase FlrB
MMSKAAPLRPPLDPDASERQNLDQAFAVFNRVSAQLSDSYNLLEGRVSELTLELAQAGAQRMAELAEKERLASRLQQVMAVLPGGVVIIDEQGLVTEANPAAVALLGPHLHGRLWREVIFEAFAPRRDDGHEISLKDGRRLSIATRSLGDEPGQLLLLTDLTETRQLQDQLARHERLSALGRMVASVAHQIRTPLTSAMLYASHLQAPTLEEGLRQRFAGRLHERLHELNHQVRDMLLFAKGELPLTDRLSPMALFEAFNNAAQSRTHGVTVRWQCDVQEGDVLCNRDTLVGAFLNLLENALQASEPIARIKVHLYKRHDRLRLCISDAGPGMAASTLARLGEPFFTTKSTGTGLGVAVVVSVIRAHSGSVQWRSRPGRGTCALVTLPLLEGALNE